MGLTLSAFLPKTTAACFPPAAEVANRNMLQILSCCSSRSQLEVPLLVAQTLPRYSVWVGFISFCYAVESKLLEVLPRDKQNCLGNWVWKQVEIKINFHLTGWVVWRREQVARGENCLVQNVNPKSRRARSRGSFVLPEPRAFLTPGDLASPTQTTSLSPGTAHRCTSGDSVRLFSFCPILMNLSVWSRAEFDLESECSFHPLCHLLKCLSGTLLKATLRACTRIANKAADMQVPTSTRTRVEIAFSLVFITF